MAIKNKLMYAFLFISVWAIASCSPYVYKSEVKTFQEGVEAASKMLVAQKEILAQYEVSEYKNELNRAGFPRLSLSDECEAAISCYAKMAYDDPAGKVCADEIINAVNSDEEAPQGNNDIYKKVQAVAVQKCGKLFRTTNGEIVEVKIEAGPQLLSQMRVLTALKQYATALAGIVEAEDKNELETSASGACSSTQQLFLTASNIDDNGTTEEEIKEKAERLEKEGEVITTVCGLLTQIGLTALDHARLKILTRVVNRADSIVGLMANYLAHEAKKTYATIARNELITLQDTVNNTVGFQGNNKPGEYAKAIESSVSKKNLFNDILSNSPENVFLSMAEAHSKLKAAINDSDTQLTPAIESVQNFLKAAEDAHTAIKALSENKTGE